MIRAIGQILAVSYPLLAISAGVRAVYQLFFKPGVTDYFPPALSAVAAAIYLVATVAFVLRKPWAWWVSVGALSFELVGVLVVGTLSLVMPEVIGRTVWHDFGIDYGFLPLIQPILGLVWLFWPENRRLFFDPARPTSTPPAR
ncbi:MAG: membrane protein [Meiothermus sp.]|nr:MAG: membrane protein [Meiothermus sp.]